MCKISTSICNCVTQSQHRRIHCILVIISQLQKERVRLEKSVADPLNAHQNFSSHFYVVTGDNIMRQNGICVFSVTVMWYLNGHVMK